MKFLKRGWISYLLMITIMTVCMEIIGQIIAFSGNHLRLIVGSIFVTFIVHLFYYKFYQLFIFKKSENYKITKGLLFSSIIGGVLMLILIIFSYNYSSSPGYDVLAQEDTLLMIIEIMIIFICIFSALICFITDGFFDNEIEEVAKLRILLGSVLFYGVLYGGSIIIGALISFITGGLF